MLRTIMCKSWKPTTKATRTSTSRKRLESRLWGRAGGMGERRAPRTTPPHISLTNAQAVVRLDKGQRFHLHAENINRGAKVGGVVVEAIAGRGVARHARGTAWEEGVRAGGKGEGESSGNPSFSTHLPHKTGRAPPRTRRSTGDPRKRPKSTIRDWEQGSTALRRERTRGGTHQSSPAPQ